MDISLIKLLLLIAAFLRHGTPDSWDIALQARVSVYLPGPAIAFSVGYYPAASGLWEPERSWEGIPDTPHVLEFSLIRFWLPLGGP